MTIKVVPVGQRRFLPVVEKKPPCIKCGSVKCREVSRVEGEPGVAQSVMYECVECGEYRL